MITLHLPFNFQWIKDDRTSYGVRGVAHCPCGTSPIETLVLEGDSHDEEPWISSGMYHCACCDRQGQWLPADSSGQVVGDTGIATPDVLKLMEF